MFRIWGKIYKNNNGVKDKVIAIDSKELNFEEKVEKGLEALCYHFDIPMPIWLSDNKTDFTIIGKTRFKAQHFIEDIDFDHLEIEVIEAK